jgi:hypothetical protein
MIPVHELLDIPRGDDLRWAGPTEVCLCGNDLFAVACVFEDKQIGMYFLDGKCMGCGAVVRLPTEIDDEEGNNECCE